MLGSLNKSGISKLLGGLAGSWLADSWQGKPQRKLKYGGIAAVADSAIKLSSESGTAGNQLAVHTNLLSPLAGALYQDQLQEQQFNLSNNKQSLFVVKLVVAAAMADGHLDGSEYQRIIDKPPSWADAMNNASYSMKSNNPWS